MPIIPITPGFTGGGSGGGAVNSVNGKTGTVVLTATDVGALTTTTGDSRYILQGSLPSSGAVYSVNSKTGTVVLTSSDVGAEQVGVAQSLLTAHISADDHTQYFNQTRGDARYVQNSFANVANGYAQLDATGKIPASLLNTQTIRYVIVADQTARLALSTVSTLTVASQVDTSTIWYLNANTSAATSSNWILGGSSVVTGVSSFNSRTGSVVSQTGDYTADQINETTTRKFTSPTEKTTWGNKQDALVSGTNIKSLFGVSILGSGNFSPTPATMGAAAAVHTHTTNDITDFSSATQLKIGQSLQSGNGITISYDNSSGKTTIASTGSSGGVSGYTSVTRIGATAGQVHSFNITPQYTFNYNAFALKEEVGATNQTALIDDFLAGTLSNYNGTNAVVFDGQMKAYTGETYAVAADSGFYSTTVKADGKIINISGSSSSSLVPAMTSNTAPAGYVASASSSFSSSYLPFQAFDKSTTSGGWISSTTPTTASPQWIRIDLPSAQTVGGYAITNRINAAFDMVNPNTWTFEGSNDGTNWTILQTVTNDTNNNVGAVRPFTLSSPATFSKYRLNITARNGTTAAFVTLHELDIFPFVPLLIKDSSGNFYSSNGGNLSPVTTPTDVNDFTSKSFSISGNITSASLLGKLPIKVYTTNSSFSIKTLYTANTQIIIPKNLTSGSSWQQINSASLLNPTTTGSAVIRCAVSRDLTNWFIWNGSTWTAISSLTPDNAGAQSLISNGMSASTFNSITTAQWTSFYTTTSGMPDNVAVAIAIDLSNAASDSASIDSLSFNYNSVSSWKLQTPAEVEIRWQVDNVKFRTIASGNYKLVYQAP
jgi:hypothetical protein